MTREARTMAGVILITVPTIQYGGYLLLSSLRDRTSQYMDNALRQNFFRAGHAHAGVIVILSLVCQVLADAIEGAAAADGHSQRRNVGKADGVVRLGKDGFGQVVADLA